MNKFNFYEKVIVRTSEPSKIEVTGELGAVLGISKNENRVWGYGVYIYSTEECWSFEESELLGTGKFDSRESFYNGSSIKVSVIANSEVK